MAESSTAPASEIADNLQTIEGFRAGRDGLGGFFPRSALLLLTTTGARSGQERTWPVVRFVIDGRLSVVGSAAGRDQHPAWYHNLLVNPQVVVEQWVDDVYESFSAVATVAAPQERDALWAEVIRQNPNFAGYPAMTTRTLPIVFLNRL
ncbi:nitroreductase family deazaflavin-dependent oxidoreductase [Kineosporia mesophila]|nr:nitroreductase family deazaflavin-dependent oxidoreductase [Kineosporia mesophila]MCD5354749.1 nitroreductase family deazaflavin-dependent oxidoreductase [Kineosporia mesophila]